MINDESLELKKNQNVDSISPHILEWGTQFIKYLEMEYTSLASELPADATPLHFQEAMLIAFGRVLEDSANTYAKRSD